MPSTRFAVLAPLALALAGCAAFEQSSEVFLEREPGIRTYSPPQPISRTPDELVTFAILSSNVYQRTPAPGGAPQDGTGEPTSKSEPTDAYAAACRRPSGLLPLPGWRRWDNFPSSKSRSKAEKLGLNVEVWESGNKPVTVAVVFEGTDFGSRWDWVSNLRWFTRFIPGHEDQYTLVAKEVGLEFANRLAGPNNGAPARNTSDVRIVSTGHSLGGGLAQHFAYSLPARAESGVPIPRVERVYAFDPSPVTGWSTVPEDIREANASGLAIDRVFEHGEVLAYIRLMASYVNPPSAAKPAIREVRYNFIRSLNPIRSHSIYQLACDLALARSRQTAASGP